MAAKHDSDIDYSKSTMAFPMDKEPQPLFVDSDIDYAKSTGAYPMYDDPEAVAIERTVEHLDQAPTGAFPTPGPISVGLAEHVAAQRKDLGLSEDPTGESDAGVEARPSTVPVPGADGKDRTARAQAKVVKPPRPRAARKTTSASRKAAKKATGT